MADKKITALTAYTTPLAADLIPIVDVANSLTKKVTISDLRAAMAGYALQFSGSIAAPADATTYYFGANYFDAVVSSTAGLAKIRIPKAGTIKSCYIEVRNRGTAGTTEVSTISIRLNNTTDTTVSAVLITSTVPNAFSNAALAIAVIAGDYIEIKWVTPTWVTNPTNVDIFGCVYIE